MKARVLMVALTLASPVASSAQNGARPVTAEMKDAFATIEKNVEQIAFKPEKERWTANVELWRIRLANTGKLNKDEFKTMEPLFTTMEDNVSHLLEPQEKERWVSNHAMWQIAMNMSGLAPDAEAAKADFTMTVMQANVARIPGGEEKERWAANVVLWKGLLGRK